MKKEKSLKSKEKKVFTLFFPALTFCLSAYVDNFVRVMYMAQQTYNTSNKVKGTAVKGTIYKEREQKKVALEFWKLFKLCLYNYGQLQQNKNK